MKVQIYSKPDCSLCEEAKVILEQARRTVPFELEEVDIRSDPELFARYQYDLPVVWIDGSKAFKHRFTEKELLARLRR